MKTIINNIELLDANGTSWKDCVETFKKGNASNFSVQADTPIAGLPKFDVPLTDEELDTELENLGYLENNMPRAVRLAVLAVKKATIGFDLPKNTCVIGCTLQGAQETGGAIWNSFFANKKAISPKWGATVTQSAICTAISRHFNFTGPSFMINQACSAFIVALDIADKMLQDGEYEAAIVVGVDCATHPYSMYIFNSLGVYTKKSVMPFDKNRSGMALGEGAACYILTKENRARQKIAAIGKIKLYTDCYNLTAPNPDGSSGKILLNNISNDNQIQFGSINCHATATKVGDEAELLAIDSLPYKTHIYGLKGSVGHTMATSAGVEMAYSIAGMNGDWIPYTSNSNDLVECNHSIVLHNIIEKETNNFAKLSFGFGGVSAGIRIDKL